MIGRIPTPNTAGWLHINAKERDKKERQGRRAKKRKGIVAQKVKPSTPIREIDALIGHEEQNEKQKKEKKKETGSGSPNQLPWTIWPPLTTMDLF